MVQYATAGPAFIPWAADGPPPSPLASNPVFFFRDSTESDEPPTLRELMDRPKTASNSTSDDQDFSDFGAEIDDDELMLGDTMRARRQQNEVTSLIEFLKTHEPPPDNFMSIPYSNNGQDNAGKWSKLKKVGKSRSKSVTRAPKQIQLPDSAVSGTTIGGHRHIAISIPLEASPFAEAPKSQYPVFPSKDSDEGRSKGTDRGTKSTKGFARTFTNENGVVTVMRPTTADSTLATPTHRSSPPVYPSFPPLPPLPNLRDSRLSNMPPRRQGSQSSNHNHIGTRPIRSGSPLANHRTGSWNTTKEWEKSSGKQSPKEFHRSAYPIRGSSMATSRRSAHPVSIDGLISLYGDDQPALSPPRGDYLRGTMLPHHTYAKNEREVNRESGPMDMYRSSSHQGHFNERTSHISDFSNGGYKTKVVPESPVLSPMEDDRPSTPMSTQNRREKVRERKRRDLEALRNAKLYGQGNSHEGETFEGHNALKPAPPRPFMPAQQSSDSTIKQAAAKPPNSPAEPKLCPIMVVVDVEPSPSVQEQPLQQSEPALAEELSKAPEKEMAIPLCNLRDNGNPTPPTSASGSPPQQHSIIDRTALTRRREWSASREQDRKRREATAAARAKIQQMALGSMTYECIRGNETDKDILRLYEAYREHRMRDMERRVRRLERNGDVWLRAIVPVLDDMHDTVKKARSDDASSIRDCASEDDVAEEVERIGRNAHRNRLSKRASRSQGRLVTGLANNDDDFELWANEAHKSNDTSGMGGIEPLMRELAGGVGRRQAPTEPLGVTDHYGVRSI